MFRMTIHASNEIYPSIILDKNEGKFARDRPLKCPLTGLNATTEVVRRGRHGLGAPNDAHLLTTDTHVPPSYDPRLQTST